MTQYFSVTFGRLLLTGGLLLARNIGAAETAGDTARLAIVSAADLNKEVDLLTVALSRDKQLALLEREQISKVLKEHEISLSNVGNNCAEVGKLLKADGLIILEKIKPQDKEVLVARLVAVDQGVVLGAAYCLWPLEKVEDWCGGVQKQFAPLLPKLKVLTRDAVPITILNVRVPLDNTRARQLETQFTSLLALRLMREKDVFVLERWHMEKLEWEKGLTADETNPFWTGSCLLDGAISSDLVKETDNIAVTLRLRKADQQQVAIEESGTKDKLPDLVERLVARVIKALDKKQSTISWNPKDEAEQLFQEAQWAFNARAFSRAMSATESAWALGKRGRPLMELRIEAYRRTAWERTSGPTINYYNQAAETAAASRVPTEFLDAAITALELFLVYVKDNPVDVGSTGPGPFLGPDLLRTASQVLIDYYASPKANPHEPRLAQLRSLARQTYKLIMEARSVDFRCWHKTLMAGAEYAGIWQENPQDIIAFCQALLAASPNDPPGSFAKAPEIRMDIQSSLLVGGAMDAATGKDARSSVVPALISGLSQSSKLEDRAAVLHLKSVLATEIKEKDGGTLVSHTWSDAETEDFYQEVLKIAQDVAEQLARKNFAYSRLGPIVDCLPAGYFKAHKPEFLKIAHLLLAPRSNPQAMESAFANYIIYSLCGVITEEEARELYNAAQAKVTQGKTLEDDFGRMLVARFPALAKEAQSDTTGVLEVSRLVTLPADSVQAKGLWTYAVHASDGEVWFLCERLSLPGEYDGAPPVRELALLRMDPATMKVTETFMYDPPAGSVKTGQRPYYPAKIVVGSDWVVFSSEVGVVKYNRKAKTSEMLSVPDRSYNAVSLINNVLYLGHSGADSGIIKLDMNRGKAALLASSMRRPAEGPLDDRAGYHVTSIIPWTDGRVLFIVGEPPSTTSVRVQNISGYAYSPPQNKWEKLYSYSTDVFAQGGDDCGNGRITADGLLLQNNNEWVMMDPSTKATTCLLATGWSGYQAKDCKWKLDRSLWRYEMGPTAYEDRTFYVVRQPIAESNWHPCLLYLNDAVGPKGVLIPLHLKEADKKTAPQEVLDITLVPNRGIILWDTNRLRFWFLPKKDIEDYVAAHKPKAGETVGDSKK